MYMAMLNNQMVAKVLPVNLIAQIRWVAFDA